MIRNSFQWFLFKEMHCLWLSSNATLFSLSDELIGQRVREYCFLELFVSVVTHFWLESCFSIMYWYRTVVSDFGLILLDYCRFRAESDLNNLSLVYSIIIIVHFILTLAWSLSWFASRLTPKNSVTTLWLYYLII